MPNSFTNPEHDQIAGRITQRGNSLPCWARAPTISRWSRRGRKIAVEETELQKTRTGSRVSPERRPYRPHAAFGKRRQASRAGVLALLKATQCLRRRSPSRLR